MTEQPTASRTRDVALQLAIAATVGSIILTAVAFWLSYEHLHDVAHHHGLADQARAWAWPATIDLFIMIGEVLMLRAGVKKKGTDWWAIALTATGSVGSIALNVAGVGTDASRVDYIVAAVPPVAALLAFGALMRQIHGALAERAAATESAVQSATTALPERSETPATVAPEAPQQAPAERSESDTATATVAAPERHETPTESATEAPKPAAPKRHQSGTKTPPKRSKPSDRDAARAAIEALYTTLGRRPLETEMVDELKRIKNKFTSPAFAKKVRAEIEKDDPALAALGTDNVTPLTG